MKTPVEHNMASNRYSIGCKNKFFSYFCVMEGSKVLFLKRNYQQILSKKFSERESEQMVRILFEDLFGFDRMRILMEPSLSLGVEQVCQMEKAVGELLNGRPIQYVTGVAEFCDLRFEVDESVLIPRPETEEMVQRIISQDFCPKRVWDVGTGSGCIAVSLARRFPAAEVYAFDVSESALRVAEGNAVSNNVNVRFVHDDVLNPRSEVFSRPVDLVVSNPPYVCESERADMEASVLDFEPDTALFVPDDDPLLFYRQILCLAKEQLNENGQVWFEINEALGDEMLRLCRELGFIDAAVIDDFAGKPRFCKASLR